MSAPVLVGYATHAGSTPEVAEAIAEVLRESGLTVDVQSVKKLRIDDKFRACVLGAPLYMFQLHHDMKSFLSRNRKTIEKLPVVIFGLGPFHNKEDELTGARETLNKELAKYAWLKPVAVEMFVGRFDPLRLGFPYKFIPAMKHIPASDERDWDAIRAWAKDVAGLLM